MPAPIVFEDTISYLLAKVTTAFRNSTERHLGGVDLHVGQTFLLIELWREDGIRQIDLAHRLNVSAPTVSNMLTGLRKIHLIKTSKTEGDGRSIRVFLTERGKLIRGDVEKRWVDIEGECVGGLRATDQVFLRDMLLRLLSTYTGKEYVEEEQL